MNLKSLPDAEIKTMIQVPTKHGDFNFVSFKGLLDEREHLAIISGEVCSKENVLVRLHSECLTGDVFGSKRCDCGDQLNEALTKIKAEGGAILYLRQEGRGIGMYDKIEAYALQDLGSDTFEANVKLGLNEDSRNYSVAAQMIKALGIKSIRLLSNNPDKEKQLKDLGILITERTATKVFVNPHNRSYLQAKVDKKGHSIKF
ncbi:MAG: GTP cyclohydrolase II [Deltaproteobacteria bacterium]|jgi:GTP cyclohydrolase II|nr:GTP cyclohydrolase II [Deltaproteobacteria bacterium]